jgi:hypothetical protein
MLGQNGFKNVWEVVFDVFSYLQFQVLRFYTQKTTDGEDICMYALCPRIMKGMNEDSRGMIANRGRQCPWCCGLGQMPALHFK